MAKKKLTSSKPLLNTSLPLGQAVSLVKKQSEELKLNFVESIDMILVINRSLTQSDSPIRGTISLPHGTGKTSNVAVFTKDESQRVLALEAGASDAGAEDLVSKIEGGKVRYDFCLASTDSMSLISKVAKKLGPRGLMPNQKDGTITQLSQEIVGEFLKKRTRFKSTKFGVIQCRVGLASQSNEVLIDNITCAYKLVASALSGSSRPDLFTSKYIKSTMGSSQKITIES